MTIALTKFLAQLGSKPDDATTATAFATLLKNGEKEAADIRAGYAKLKVEFEAETNDDRKLALRHLLDKAYTLIDMQADFVAIAKRAQRKAPANGK